MYFSEKPDEFLISFALNIWANYIETYCVSMSAEDAKNRPYKAKQHYAPNYLNSQQKQLVKRLHKLSSIYEEKANAVK